MGVGSGQSGGAGAGQALTAGLYVILSNVLGLFAAFAGAYIARNL